MKVIFATLVVAFLSLPNLLFAQQLVPIQCANPDTCGSCEFVSMINNVIQFIVGLGTLIAVAIFIYAGFLMVTSRGDTGAITKAKGLFMNVVIGLVIILAAFLIVNTIIAGFVKTGSPVYSWQTIECVYPKTANRLLDTSNIRNEGGSSIIGGVGAYGVPGGPGGPLGQCFGANDACSVGALTAAGFSSTQANIMSCIAMTESSGIPSTPPYNETNPGSNSSACGTFQITRTTWNNNRPSGACSDWRSNCQNASCNIQVARTLVQNNGYRDWTCPNCNSKAQACVNQYGG